MGQRRQEAIAIMLANHRGKARGERHGQAKLTDQSVLIIRELNLRGTGATAIAKIAGMSAPSIRHVIKRRSWKHV